MTDGKREDGFYNKAIVQTATTTYDHYITRPLFKLYDHYIIPLMLIDTHTLV